MMNTAYYEAIDRMSKAGVDAEYINGWASGFLHNPKREEQRASEAYEAGYATAWRRRPRASRAWIRK